MAKRLAKKVLWIGWDAADWKMINPLIDAGLMPNLEKMVNEGVMGNLATLDPPMSPTLWTAMATGKRPYKHGIHGFTEIDPSGTAVRPSYITSRKVKGIWNMLQHHGLKTHQVGWWPSHPAEPTNGIYISNFWHKSGKEKDRHNWPLAPGCVHPKEMEDIFADLRVHPTELTAAHLQPFIPLAHKIDQSKPKYVKLINSVRKVTADAACIQSAATYIMTEHNDYDLMCVYFDAIDHYGHGFMKYSPPRRPHIPEDLYEYFKDVNVSGYRYHDMILGRLLQLAGEETIVVLVSDHGFHPDHLRPASLPLKEEPAAPALEHSPYGIIVVKGPGIKKDERIYGASLIDMCPTILSMFGLPIAKDFDGKILTSIYEEPIEIDLIDSWEDIPGFCGQHEKEVAMDPGKAQEEMQQLIDLGYIEDHGGNQEQAIEMTEKTNNYFLARAFVNGGRQADALPLYEELWEKYRDNARFGIRLVNCYLSLDMIKEARETADDVFELKLSDSPSLLVLDGTLLLKEGKHKKAVAAFEEAVVKMPKSANINLQLAQGYLKLKMFKKAQEAALRELEISYQNPVAHRIIGRIYFMQKDFDQAAEYALNAIGLRYHFPMAHDGLGDALVKLEHYEAAAQAYEVALSMFNQFVSARRKLAKLYENKLNQPEKAAILLEEGKAIMEDRQLLTIVSGFARSGTSMLMQMLEKGGQPLFIDDSRPADEHNPNGYYEHKMVKTLHHNKSFLKELGESVVKIYAPRLPFIPPNQMRYKVIFVERPIIEIIQSRQKVQEQKQDQLNLVAFNRLGVQEKRVKKWMENHPNLEFMIVKFEDLMNQSMEEVERINEFLGGKLDVNAMISAIDPNIGELSEELLQANKDF